MNQRYSINIVDHPDTSSLASMLWLLRPWRFLACLVGSILLAAWLARSLDGFNERYGFVLVAACSALGLFLEFRALGGRGPSQPSTISKPVAVLALAFFGAIFGALIAGFFRSVTIALIALATAPYLVSLWRAAASRRHVAFRDNLLWAISLLAGFAALIAVIPDLFTRIGW